MGPILPDECLLYAEGHATVLPLEQDLSGDGHYHLSLKARCEHKGEYHARGLQGCHTTRGTSECSVRGPRGGPRRGGGGGAARGWSMSPLRINCALCCKCA